MSEEVARKRRETKGKEMRGRIFWSMLGCLIQENQMTIELVIKK